jgi:hypothetical protein
VIRLALRVGIPAKAGVPPVRRAEGGIQMSVLIITKVQGDTAKFSQALTDRASEFTQIADRARSVGAIHHQFGVGDGYVMIVDEWETADDFQKFFTDPDLQAFVASVGGAAGPPEVTVSTAMQTPDRF